MKKVFLILLLSTGVHAEEKVFCSSIYLKSAKKYVEAQSNTTDKFKHCAVSCYLALRCPDVGVKLTGILKELYDWVGPGQAERADLQANYAGIKFASTINPKSDDNCVIACDEIYPTDLCLAEN